MPNTEAIKALQAQVKALEERIGQLEKNSDIIADLMSTLGGKFRKASGDTLTDELANFFDEVGRTLSSVRKGRG